MEGLGVYKWSDGKSYIGEYHNDRKHGYGIYKWGAKLYMGQWKRGQQSGLGIYTNGDRPECRYGLWEEGRRL